MAHEMTYDLLCVTMCFLNWLAKVALCRQSSQVEEERESLNTNKALMAARETEDQERPLTQKG